jgi:hypothetical protein
MLESLNSEDQYLWKMAKCRQLQLFSSLIYFHKCAHVFIICSILNETQERLFSSADESGISSAPADSKEVTRLHPSTNVLAVVIGDSPPHLCS